MNKIQTKTRKTKNERLAYQLEQIEQLWLDMDEFPYPSDEHTPRSIAGAGVGAAESMGSLWNEGWWCYELVSLGGGFQQSGSQPRSCSGGGFGSWAKRCKMSCRYTNTSMPCR